MIFAVQSAAEQSVQMAWHQSALCALSVACLLWQQFTVCLQSQSGHGYNWLMEVTELRRAGKQ